MDMNMSNVTIVKQAGSTLAEQVTSLEEGYAELLQENGQLGEQQEITRQAYQNLLHEKDEVIKARDKVIQDNVEVIKAKLKHIELLDEALAQAREANATLDHRLEQQNRRTTSTVSTGSGDPGLSHPVANSSTCDCGHPGPFDSRNYCVKCGRKHNVPDPGLKFGEVQLAKRIYHNIHYPAIRALLGYEACRVLDIVLDLEQPGVSD
jgi:hypothetical protein